MVGDGFMRELSHGTLQKCCFHCSPLCLFTPFYGTNISEGLAANDQKKFSSNLFSIGVPFPTRIFPTLDELKNPEKALSDCFPHPSLLLKKKLNFSFSAQHQEKDQKRKHARTDGSIRLACVVMSKGGRYCF